MSNVFIFVVYPMLSGNFKGSEIWHGIFWGLVFGPGIFWGFVGSPFGGGFDSSPIRSSPSPEIQSTPLPLGLP